MILSVCANPSFDKTVILPTLIPGQVNRLISARTDPGGKGINVALTASALGADVCCCGFAGEDNRDSFLNMKALSGLNKHFLGVPGAIRTNMKIRSLDGSPVTELNETGMTVTHETCAFFLDWIRQWRSEIDYCVLTGSLPPGCPESFYADIMRCVGGDRCVIDTTGTALLAALDRKPFLIKPNLTELGEWFGRSLENRTDAVTAMKAIQGAGAKNVLLSMGANGSLLLNGDRLYAIPALRTEVRSTVGAGDALIGGLLYGLTITDSLPDAVLYGVAAATVKVSREGTEPVTKQEVSALLPQCSCEPID